MPDLTAAQAVAEQLCSPQCLLAAGPSLSCDCTCGGRWHGALGQAVVPDTAAFRTPRPPPQTGPHLLDELHELYEPATVSA